MSRRQLLPQLSELLRDGLGDLAGLMEVNNRSKGFSDYLTRFMREELEGLRDHVSAAASELDERPGGTLQDTAHHLDRLQHVLDLLFQQRDQHWQHGEDHTRAVMAEFQDTVRQLNETLIDKDLLERQSQVLERIILSYERLTQWQEFVGSILGDFRAIFPFRFFFVAFAEENSLALSLYYAADCSEETARYARQTFAGQMRQKLGLSADAAVDIDEHWLDSAGEPGTTTHEIDMITVEVPEYTTQLAGVMGVAYGAQQELTPQERSTIRSILSVMVMVVGSSRALTRTMEELQYFAVRDPLTGLYNRRHFNELLEEEVGRALRHHHSFTLLLIDLDDFKDINDTFGHPTGDRLLRDMTNLLHEALRSGDMVARIGGDEFGLVLPETDSEGGQTLAETLRSEIEGRTFVSMEGEHFHLTVSIGVVTFPADAEDFNNLLARVDEALYRAKEKGKNEVAVPGQEWGGSPVRRQRLDAERMREALQEGRIRPYFHAILDAHTNEVHGFEALARLQQSDGETLPAGRFMGAVERYGLARDLDRSMLYQALSHQCRSGCSERGQPRLFINLSPQEIQNRGILGYAEELCEHLGLPPDRIVFELLERQAIEDLPGMRRFLDDLRAKGFAFALDDFGSGYNSFHYLRELQFEYVKIDGAFVRNILQSQVDWALVENLSRLCSDLGIATIAEFIESEEILASVRAMNVDYVQGFHLSLPTPEIQPPPAP